MLVFSSKLYMDKAVARKPKRYCRMLKRKKCARVLYCLTLPVNRENCLEIYSSVEFWFRYQRQRNTVVIGLAKSRESAEKLLCQICADVYRQTGDVSAKQIHQYFQSETEKQT